jgi:hypothetical protein
VSIVEECVKELIKITIWSGRLPFLLDQKDVNDKFATQFCHGSPALIPLMTLAADIYPKMEELCLEVAQKAGEITWQRGILMKGGGLCHGIAGNAYLLHNLYRTFKKLAKRQKDLELEGKTDEVWDEGEEPHAESKRLTKVSKLW